MNLPGNCLESLKKVEEDRREEEKSERAVGGQKVPDRNRKILRKALSMFLHLQGLHFFVWSGLLCLARAFVVKRVELHNDMRGGHQLLGPPAVPPLAKKAGFSEFHSELEWVIHN